MAAAMDEGAAECTEQLTATESTALEASGKHTQTSGDAEEGEVVEQDTRPFFCRHITVFVKICGVLIIAGMWACTVFLIRRRLEGDFTPWYTLAMTTVVTLIELIWYVNKCACCKDEGGCCCTCWRVLIWIDNWKKGIVYILLSPPVFIRGHVLAIVCGVILIVLGLLYVIKSCSYCRCVGGKKFVRRSTGGAHAKPAPGGGSGDP